MKLAVLAVTKNGAVLAHKLSQALPCEVFIKERHCTASDDVVQQFTSLKELIKEIFPLYDGFVFIAAAGIAVRMIAPYIMHKSRDPAVVVLDEQGKHAISLLSGHIGGANALTERIAAIVNAVPVITTATDVGGKLAADQIAVALGLRIGNIGRLKDINAALVEGKNVPFYIDATLKEATFLQRAMQDKGIEAKLLTRPSVSNTMSVLISSEEPTAFLAAPLILWPGRLCAGIGCRKGVTKEEILMALQEACAHVGKALQDIVSISSTVVKRDEKGLLEIAANLNIPIYFYENEILHHTIATHHLALSDFVLRQIGVGNVCESAAITSSQSKKLALRKTKYPKVTVALAWER